MNSHSTDLSLDGTEVAVVGLDCRLPGADGPDAFWTLLREGRETIRRFTPEELHEAGVEPELAARADYVPAAGVLEDIDRFDASFFGISAREAELMDPQHRLLQECAWRALEHAGYAGSPLLARAGTFAGVGPNTYLLRQLLPTGAADAGLHLLLASDKDFAPTRLAYRMNLQGPAVAVQTACSTGLVAVHMAARSLLAGECDLALAAASSVRVPHYAGVLWQEGSIFSREGRCRAFDRAADGCVAGNGVAAVVLRRLDDALADGDTVYAVLLGSAVNNDGTRKVGYAAPSVAGQAEVIRQAHAAAGVRSAEIGYVEAHGTGTRLGDPVECAALAAAFAGAPPERCALGSLKTNLGHLDVAAGLAGFIKTVLALHNRQIPPSLHFSELNPEIDLGGTGMYVNTALSPWRAVGGRRVAGVSSFGVGGTNAHAVLAEAPRPTATRADPSLPRCFVLSGATRAALVESARNLAAHLEAHPGLHPADVAHTLTHGRAALPERLAVVASSLPELARALRDPALPQRVRRAGEGGADASGGEGSAAERARTWLAGAPFPAWGAEGERGRRIPLPGVAFQRTRVWIDAPRPGATAPPGPIRFVAPPPPAVAGPAFTMDGRVPLDQWFYMPVWVRDAAFRPFAAVQADAGPWLLFAPPGTLGNDLRGALPADSPVTIVTPGTALRLEGKAWEIDPEDESHYRALMDALARRGAVPRRIVHAWAAGPLPEGEDAFDAAQRLGLRSLLRLGRALERRADDTPVHLDVLSTGRFAVVGAEALDPARATLAGPCLVLGQELAGVTCRGVDLELPAQGARAPLLGALRTELSRVAGGTVALRGASRWTRRVERVDAPAADAPEWRTGGAYLVTGGFGGVGHALAGWLASRYGARLALVAGPGEPESAATALADDAGWLAHEADHRIAGAKLELIHNDPELVQLLERLSALRTVEYWQAAGLAPAPGVEWTRAGLAAATRVLPPLVRLLECMVRLLATHGFVSVDGERVAWTAPLPAEGEAAACRAAILERAPGLAGLLDFFDYCVAQYPRAIPGEVEPISILYPGGSEEPMRHAADAMLRRSTGQPLSELFAEWVARRAREAAPRTLRILEFGAGNGLLTREVAAALARAGAVNVEYWVTDLGNGFVLRAERTAQEQGWAGMRFRTLDVSAPPAEQGVEEGSFDLVFGLNVVHATPDVRQTLANLRRLLRPGGHAALIESVRQEPWVDLVAGLAEGWWYFQDDLRAHSPLLPADAWVRAFGEAGFGGAAAYPVTGMERADCALVMARAEPGTDAPPNPALSPGRATLADGLRARGAAEVRVLRADLARRAEVERVLAETRAAFGGLDGVVHAAGRIAGALVGSLDDARVETELGARTRGALHLAAALERDPVPLLALSSSLNTMFGGEGQAAYVGANAVLAAIAEASAGGPCRTVSIEWDRWRETARGRDFEDTYRAVTGGELGGGMLTAEGVEAFRRAVATGLPQVAVSTQPFHARYERYLRACDAPAAPAFPAAASRPSAPVTEVAEPHPSSGGVADPAVAAAPPLPSDPPSTGESLEAALLSLCRGTLGSVEVELHDKLVDLGADSLDVLQIQSAIEKTLGVRVFAAPLMTQTLEQLAAGVRDPGGHTASLEVVDAGRLRPFLGDADGGDA